MDGAGPQVEHAHLDVNDLGLILIVPYSVMGHEEHSVIPEGLHGEK